MLFNVLLKTVEFVEFVEFVIFVIKDELDV